MFHIRDCNFLDLNNSCRLPKHQET